jgi:hypothetical protein
MKKMLTILTLLAYFTVSTGFVVNMHYCMDRFHSWELGGQVSERCDSCGMSAKKNSCCHDQVKLVKVSQDASQAFYDVYAFSAPALVPALPVQYLAPTELSQPQFAWPIHGPPLLSKQDTYLRNGVFRI